MENGMNRRKMSRRDEKTEEETIEKEGFLEEK